MSNEAQQVADAAHAPPRVPGEAGIWVLVFGDLFVFAVFYGTFGYYRLVEPDVFRTSQAALNQPLGLFNTLLLLTSSLMVAKALAYSRAGNAGLARNWTMGALLLAAGFVGTKMVEYGQKIAEGLSPATNTFFMLYFVFTGIHLLHVVVGLGVLAFLRARIARPSTGPDAIAEGCSIYWHMVDVLWVILFAIFYLHR